MTHISIPTSAEVFDALSGLSRFALTRLSKLSGVSIHTLIKIRDGVTADPGVDTVSRIWPYVGVIRQVFLDPPEAPEAVPVPVADARPARPSRSRKGNSGAVQPDIPVKT